MSGKKLAAQNEVERLRRKCARLEELCREQARYTGMFEEMTYLAAEDFQLPVFLGRLMKKVLQAVGAEAGSLLLWEKSNETLEFAVVKGRGAKKLQGQRLPADEGIAGHVLKTGRPYLCSDVSRDRRWSPTIATELRYPTRNIIAVPLLIGGKPEGVIELINKKDGAAFTRADLSLLKALASQAAIGIENARLLAEARRRSEQFMTLARISTILNSSLRPQEVRKRAMEAVVELLECETGSLYLIDEEKGELYFEVALGKQEDAVRKIRLKLGEGIAGWVAKEGKSELVADTSSDPRWSSKVDEKVKFQTRNMITVPVKAKGKAIGVLQAINKLHDKKFDLEDLRLLESLADQVAIALENARLYDEQKQMFMSTAEALATAIEKRDPYTGGHTKRVRDFCLAAAKYLPLSEEEREWLELAAILHDVGKIGVDDQILRKPGRLSDEEFAQMKMHPFYGYEILEHIRSLAPVIPGVKGHHERYDGRGYPEGKKNGETPFLARLIAVADTWDAMTSDRPYRPGLPDEEAAAELRRCTGTQFDPELVEAFLKAYENGEIISQHKREKKKEQE